MKCFTVDLSRLAALKEEMERAMFVHRDACDKNDHDWMAQASVVYSKAAGDYWDEDNRIGSILRDIDAEIRAIKYPESRGEK